MEASATPHTILSQCGVNMFKLLMQEYNGCSAMARKEGGFQVKIRNPIVLKIVRESTEKQVVGTKRVTVL